MLDLSPTKLIVVLIVAVIVVGPRRLPRVAHELARGWRRLRALHSEIDREVRKSIPGLPPDLDLVRYARSPVALLNRFADALPAEADEDVTEPRVAIEESQEDRPGTEEVAGSRTARALPAHAGSPPPPARGIEAAAIARRWQVVGTAVSTDDPSLN